MQNYYIIGYGHDGRYIEEIVVARNAEEARKKSSCAGILFISLWGEALLL